MVVNGPEQISLGFADALAVAVQLHKDGRLQEAESIYRALLDLRPDNADALHFLGMLCHQLGRSREAVDLIRKAVGLVPEHADALNNLGNVLKDTGEPRQAAEAYRRVIALRPDHADALNNLGTVLRQQDDLEEAIAAYRRAISLRPDHAEAHHNLANALRAAGRLDESIAHDSRAMQLRPGNPAVYRNLAIALHGAGRSDRAVAVVEEWLSHKPGDPFARHLLAAVSGRDVPERAPDEYVRQLFDGVACKFDENLRDLEYRAPDLVAAAVAAQLPLAGGSLEVLDAGCGTGLCAAHLRPYARRLIGVDLSPAMLARASARGLYDDLVTAELSAYLRERPGLWDLIVSADTLIYFGLLEPILSAAAAALRPGGLIVFTLEWAGPEQAPGGFRLLPHGRYSHTEEYLRRSIAGAGLAIASLATCTLRMEATEPVRGAVVCARKEAA